MKRKFLKGKDWFFEDIIPGESPTFTWGFLPQKTIFFGNSKFQKFEIFETERFGRILTLDGMVQFSTNHEYVYHEMLVHPAFFYHKNPEKVLIIGGGDGGVLREVVKYESVKEIFLVDIDKMVTDVSKKYLPSLPGGSFSDKRLKLLFEDALNFVKQYKNYFDIIIEDLTDPSGVSLNLWTNAFYKDILRALKENGVAAFQSAYLNDGFAKRARREIRKVFPFYKMHKAYVGCFPFDEHTFSLGSKVTDFRKTTLNYIKKKFKRLNLQTKYYSPEIHFASAILPKGLKEI